MRQREFFCIQGGRFVSKSPQGQKGFVSRLCLQHTKLEKENVKLTKPRIPRDIQDYFQDNNELRF